MATKKRPRPASSGGGAVSVHHPRVASKVEVMGDDSSPSLDWIAALASKASSSSARPPSGRCANAGQHAAVTTKEERIERRRLKKQRRQIQKEIEKERNNETQRAKKELTTVRNRADQEGTEPIRRPVAAGAAAAAASPTARRKDRNRTSLVSRERLERLASKLHEHSLAISHSFQDHRRPPPRRAHQPQASSPHPPPAPFKKRKWEQSSLQPRKRDYGGIGLARPTLYLELDDPSFVPKLEEEFHEHVPGFYGRSVFHSSQKRRSSQAALWRTLSDRAKASGIKVDGKKLSDLSPDERVNAMLRAGLI